METALMAGVIQVENPIERILREHGLTPAELAKVVGRAASTISALRRGELASISDAVAARIEELFHIPAEQLKADYRRWLEAQSEELRDRLRGDR